MLVGERVTVDDGIAGRVEVGDFVAGEWAAAVYGLSGSDWRRCAGSASRLLQRGCARVIHHNQIALRVESLREIALAFQSGRDRVGEVAGLTLAQSLVGLEEERLVIRVVVVGRKGRWATDCVAILIALEVGLCRSRQIGREAVGIGVAVSDVLKDASVQTICAGFRREGDDSAAGVTPFRRKGVGQHLELLNRVHLRDRGNCIQIVLRCVGSAVEQTLGCGDFAAINSERIGVGLALIVVAGVEIELCYALSEVDHLERIADVERHALHELAFDDIAAIRLVGDQFWRGRHDKHRFVRGGGLQNNVFCLGRAYFKLDIGHCRDGEIWHRRVECIDPGLERWKQIDSGLIGGRLPLETCCGALDFHRHVRYGGPAGVGDVPCHQSALSVRHDGTDCECKKKKQNVCKKISSIGGKAQEVEVRGAGHALKLAERYE